MRAVYEAEAWEQYCDSGVIQPGYEGEIATRRALVREWAAAGEPLV